MILLLLIITLAHAGPFGPVTLPLRCDVWLGGIATNHLAEARALRAYEDEFMSWYQLDGAGLLGRVDLARAIVGRELAFVKRRADGSLRIGRGVIEVANFSLVPGATGARRIARIGLRTEEKPLDLMVGERERADRNLLDVRIAPTERWTDQNPGFIFQERYATWLPVHFGRREFHYQFDHVEYEREANLLYAHVWPRETGLPMAWDESGEHTYASTTFAGQTVALLYRARAYGDHAGRLAQPRIIEGTLGRVLMVRVPDRDLTITDGNSPTYHPRTLLWEFLTESGPRFVLQEADQIRGLDDLRLVEPLELRLKPAPGPRDVVISRER